MTALAGDKDADAGWRTVVLEMIYGVRAAVLRFPAVAVFLFAAAVEANLLVADIDWFKGRDVLFDPELVIGLSGGALAALAVVLFGEARRYAAGLRAGAGILAGLIISALIAFSGTFNTFEWTLIAGLLGAVLVAPFLGQGGPKSFWMFSAKTAFAGLLALLALLLFAGGISAILASLSLLFGLDIPDELYQHVWAFTALLAAPLFGLGQLPQEFDEEPGQSASGFVDKGMHALGDFVAAPLLIVYALILHAYALKIVISGEVPQGQIGWLVLVYGLFVFGALLTINPFFDRARAPTRLFLRFWPVFLPVPLVLLFYALWLRVGAYGFTPDRVLLGLFGAVTAIIVVLQLFPRLRGDIRWIAALPVLALIFGSFGPQGALGVSLSSQASRFLRIVNNPPVDGKRHDEALAALGFLNGHEALSRVAPAGMDLSTSTDGFSDVAKAWGLDPTRRFSGARGFMFHGGGGATVAFSVDGYDAVVQGVRLNVGARDPQRVRLPTGQELGFTLKSDALIVSANGRDFSFAIPKEFIQTAAQRGDATSPEVALEAEGRNLKLLLTYLYIDRGETESLEGTIMLRAGDWGQGGQPSAPQ